MAETPEQWAYLVAPLSREWRTREEAHVLLDAWLSTEGKTGVPSVTVSRRPIEAPSTAVYLASPCDTCTHTLNWHRNDVGCTFPRCVRGTFVPLDPQGS